MENANEDQSLKRNLKQTSHEPPELFKALPLEKLHAAAATHQASGKTSEATEHTFISDSARFDFVVQDGKVQKLTIDGGAGEKKRIYTRIKDDQWSLEYGGPVKQASGTTFAGDICLIKDGYSYQESGSGKPLHLVKKSSQETVYQGGARVETTAGKVSNVVFPSGKGVKILDETIDVAGTIYKKAELKDLSVDQDGTVKFESKGEKHRISRDGTQLVSKAAGELTFKDGKLVAAKRADGTRLTFRWEGEELTKLTINEQYSYGLSGGNWTYTSPNGTEKFKGPVTVTQDGTCTYGRDALKEVVTLAGARSLVHDCGTVCQLDKQGNLDKLKRPNGDSLECHWQNGTLSTLIECRGASKTTWVKEANENKWTSLDSIGASRYDLQVTREGELSFEASSGSRYNTHPDGSRTWSLRDGSKLEMRPDYGATKVKLDDVTLTGSYTKDKLTGISEERNGQTSNWKLENNIWTSPERPGIERRNLQMGGTYSYVESDASGVREIRYPDGSLRQFERQKGEITKVTEQARGEKIVWNLESGNLWSSVQNRGGQLVKLQEERTRVATRGSDYRYTTNDGLSHIFHLDGTEATEPKQMFKYGSRTYDEGTPLFQLANRELKDPKQKQNFIHDMEAFARRADVQGLSDNTIADAFKEVKELLDSRLPDEKTGWRLAKEVMHHLAEPRRIDQGYHGTCNVAIIEVITAATRPDRFAALVKEAAISGAVTTSGGNKIALDSESRKADFEAKSFDPYEPYYDGSRSYASQLFQIAAVNTHYALKNPNYTYIQKAPDKGLDTGERLVDRAGNIKAREPDLQNDQLIQLAKELGNVQMIILEAPGTSNTLTEKLGNDAQLLARLEELKKAGKLPVGVMVHTGSEPYWTQSGSGKHGGSGGWHVETIWDVDVRGKILVDNQWGKASDHEGSRRLSANQLFTAMTKVR